MSRPTPRDFVANLFKVPAPPAPKPGTALMGFNENPEAPSPKAVAAALDAIKQANRYPDMGQTALREALAAHFELDPGRVFCGSGSDELIHNLVHAFAGPGDEVIFTEYCFPSYATAAIRAGATPVKAPETDDLYVDVDAILECLSDHTRVVLLGNPNNPTGTYIPDTEVRRLISGLPEHVILAYDAAYAEYATADDYMDGMAEARTLPNFAVLRTFSKFYCLAGMRVGWGYASADISDAMTRVRGTFNVTAPAQAAAIAALEDREHCQAMLDHNREWMAWLSGELTGLGLHFYPTATNFVTVRFADADGPTGAKAALGRLAEHDIHVRPLDNYGLTDCLRISLGTPDENKRLVTVLSALLGS